MNKDNYIFKDIPISIVDFILDFKDTKIHIRQKLNL